METHTNPTATNTPATKNQAIPTPIDFIPQTALNLSQEAFPGGSRTGAHNPEDHTTSHVRGHSRLDLNVPLLSYLAAPRDVYEISGTVRAIILDFDGTTMKFNYTEGMRQMAYRDAIQSMAMETLGRPLNRSELVRCHNPAINKPEEEMAEIIATELSTIIGKPVHGADLFARWMEQCGNIISNHEANYGRPPHSAIVKGMRALIDGANEREIPVSICTAGAHQFVEPLLRAGGLMEHLNPTGNVFVNRHPDIRSKPHADPYLLVCEKLGLEPSQILVAEDTATGALAALRAGARVIFQPSGNREQTIRNLLWHVRNEHAEWIDGRPGAVTVLSRDQGWSQVRFPSRAPQS